MTILLATLVFTSAAGDFRDELNQIKTRIAAESFVEANQALIRLHRQLYATAGIENCRPPVAAVQQLKQPKATESLLQSLESALGASDYAAACKDAMLLGVSLQGDLSRLTPAQRLAQQEQAFPTADAKGRPNLAGMEQLMWANYEAGQIAKAESLARDLDSQATAIGPEFMPDVFQNSARTLLGLIRLNPSSPSMPEAVDYLRRSANVQPTMMLLYRGPAVRLADALWKAGEQAAVVEYLEKMKDHAWKPDAQLVARWYEDAKAGKRPDFFRGASETVVR